MIFICLLLFLSKYFALFEFLWPHMGLLVIVQRWRAPVATICGTERSQRRPGRPLNPQNTFQKPQFLGQKFGCIELILRCQVRFQWSGSCSRCRRHGCGRRWQSWGPSGGRPSGGIGPKQPKNEKYFEGLEVFPATSENVQYRKL